MKDRTQDNSDSIILYRKELENVGAYFNMKYLQA